MDFTYDREEFLSRTEICERLIPEIRAVFTDNQYYVFQITEEEVVNLLTLKEHDQLDFNIRHVLDHHTGQYAHDCYWEVSSKIKDLISEFCYQYRSYSFGNYHDFP